MRAFDSRITAAAIGLTPKELANLLTRVPILASGTPGKRRHIGWDDLRRLDLTARLAQQGLSAAAAAQHAWDLLNGEAVALAAGLQWRFDPAAHAQDLERRLRAAAERVVPRRRGRPPAR